MNDSDKLCEYVSSLVDGELEAHELDLTVKAMSSNQELLRNWERYHLISDAIKNNLPHRLTNDLSVRVMSALESEPTIFAPQATTLDSKISPWFKPAAGLALAASVTAVAIFGTQAFIGGGGQGQNAQIAEAPQQMPSSEQFNRIAGTPTLVSGKKQQPIPSNMNKYLVNHNQYSIGVYGVLPYARIVGYSSEQAD